MKIFFYLLAVIGVLFFSADRVLALGGLDATADRAGFEQKDVLKISANVLNIVLSLVGVLFLMMMITGGYLWMTAAGNDQRISTAKTLIVAAVIGLLIVVAAYAITAFVGESFK